MSAQNRITQLRKKRGLSMRRLAQKVGTSQQQIDRLEKGKRRLTVDWMERLSLALDCSIMDLLPSDQRERDGGNVCKAKVIGAIDSSNGGSLKEFDEKDIYALFFGRPKAINNPRLFGLQMQGNGLDGIKDGSELIFSEIDPQEDLPAGKFVLCAARTGQYFLRETPVTNTEKEIVKAVLVKLISDV